MLGIALVSSCVGCKWYVYQKFGFAIDAITWRFLLQLWAQINCGDEITEQQIGNINNILMCSEALNSVDGIASAYFECY